MRGFMWFLPVNGWQKMWNSSGYGPTARMSKNSCVRAGIPPLVSNQCFTDSHGRPGTMALANDFLPDTHLKEVKYYEIHDTTTLRTQTVLFTVRLNDNIVACRPVASQRPRNKQLYNSRC
jgi:hypothetical protein